MLQVTTQTLQHQATLSAFCSIFLLRLVGRNLSIKLQHLAAAAPGIPCRAGKVPCTPLDSLSWNQTICLIGPKSTVYPLLKQEHVLKRWVCLSHTCWRIIMANLFWWGRSQLFCPAFLARNTASCYIYLSGHWVNTSEACLHIRVFEF